MPLTILAGLSIAALGCVTTAQPAASRSPRDQQKTEQLRADMRRMIEVARDRVFPALVNIHVVTVDYWGGKERKGRAVGSGTIISPKGYIITNQHVTNRGRKFKCTLSDKQELSAELVGEDPLTDLAVLKLDLSECQSPAISLPVARFGDSDDVRVGDHVMAMGSPLALSRSVTLGIVSNTERVFTGGWSGDYVDEILLEGGQRTGLFTRWIQHDALIHPGNSGGPLVNLQGEVVGINELGGAALGFAIPCNLAKTVSATLIESGEVVRSWIGVSLKPIKKTGLDQGVLINSVVSGGPADKAGIQAGDVFLRINGTAETVRFPEQVPPLMKRIAALPIGSTMEITFDRRGATQTASLITERLQKDRGDEIALRAWGITVQEITEKMARDRRLDNTAGVLVSSIRSGGPAQLAEPALGHGVVILAIDGRPIPDLPAIVEQYESIMDTEPLPEHLLFEFDRNGKNHLTLLKPKPDKDEDPPREVPKAWIGVATQPVLKKLAEKLDHPDRLGFRVTRVYPRTRAAESDLGVGDVILALEGNALTPRGMQDAGLFARQVRKLDIDELATLTVLREGATLEVAVSLERSRRTTAEARRDRNRDFDLTVRELTFFDRDDHRWDDSVRGVLVERV
ncbi:MAG: trypsin-like peptidase domain-containing protein, partial [Dehalococcoidia bacterium]